MGGLYDCLAGIHDGQADESILDVYSDVRRRMWTDVIDVVSSDNIRRLFGQDPDRAAETDDFIKLINVAEKDEKVRDELRAVSFDPIFYVFFLLCCASAFPLGHALRPRRSREAGDDASVRRRGREKGRRRKEGRERERRVRLCSTAATRYPPDLRSRPFRPWTMMISFHDSSHNTAHLPTLF